MNYIACYNFSSIIIINLQYVNLQTNQDIVYSILSLLMSKYLKTNISNQCKKCQ